MHNYGMSFLSGFGSGPDNYYSTSADNIGGNPPFSFGGVFAVPDSTAITEQAIWGNLDTAADPDAGWLLKVGGQWQLPANQIIKGVLGTLTLDAGVANTSGQTQMAGVEMYAAFVVVCIDGTGAGSTASLYVNGNLVSSASDSPGPLLSTDTVYLGFSPDGASVDPFAGYVNMAFYENSCLTAAQVRALWQQLQHYGRLNESADLDYVWQVHHNAAAESTWTSHGSATIPKTLTRSGTLSVGYWPRVSWLAVAPSVAGTETSAEMDIYVRDADGDDSYPGTTDAPVATLARADELIPYHVKHTIRIHLGPHSGSGYAQHSFASRDLEANIYLIGDGGGGSTDGFTVVKAEAAAGAGTSADSVVAAGMSAAEYNGMGEYFGKTIQINSGLAAGDRRTIRNNTATEIFPNAPFSAAVAQNDLYEILEPEVVIYDTTGTSSPPFINGHNTASASPQLLEDPNYFCLVNLKFATSVVTYVTLNFGPGIVLAYGLTFAEEVRLISSGGMFRSGFEYYDFDATDLTAPSLVTDLSLTRTKQWLGWGITAESEDVGQGSIWLNGSSFTCDGFFNGEQLLALDMVYCSMYGGSLWGAAGFSTLIARGRGALLEVISIVNDIIIGTATGAVGAVAVYDGAKGRIAVGDYDIDISSSGTTIAAFEKGSLYLQGGAGTITITSATGIGIVTTEDGEVVLQTALPTIAAAGGDLSEDYGDNIRNVADLAVYGDAYIDMYHGRIRRGFP